MWMRQPIHHAVSPTHSSHRFTMLCLFLHYYEQSTHTWMMLSSEAARLAWVSGTPLGRAVVPLVCKNRASSSGCGGSCRYWEGLGFVQVPALG